MLTVRWLPSDAQDINAPSSSYSAFIRGQARGRGTILNRTANAGKPVHCSLHLRNLRPIPSCVLRDSVPQWQPFGLFDDEHEDDDEDDPQSSYLPLNSA